MSIAIITGASSGLGREYALALYAKHPEIDEYWLIARREDRLKELAAKLGGKKIRILPYDLTKQESYDGLEAELAKEKPEVRYLINNSGFGKLGDFDKMPIRDTGDMVRLNCLGLTAVAGAVIPYMKKGAGAIFVCSIAAFSPNARMAVYSSTKAYVLSLSRAVRFELKEKGINVLAACPGPMNTEFLPTANISPGKSFAFDHLPRVKPAVMAAKSVEACDRGKAVYTNRFFYKLYRVLAKILPASVTMNMSKC